MELLRKAEEFVGEVFIKANNTVEISHHKRTVYWIRELKPNADETLLVAGMLHDIERGFNGDWKAGSDDTKQLQKHQEFSAEEAEKFLVEQGASPEFVARVQRLILRHEEGGDEDQNILCDADCLAWFEEKAMRNAQKAKQSGTEEKMRKKLEYVLSRISTAKAREVAKGFYTEAMAVL